MEVAHESSDPSDYIVNSMWLRERLNRLSDEDRAIVELHIVERLSHAETGLRVGMAEGAVRVRYHRAIKRLRQMEADDDLVIVGDLGRPERLSAALDVRSTGEETNGQASN
jgi:DNA-directed RNA polymerase specialized sigma24 family protein